MGHGQSGAHCVCPGQVIDEDIPDQLGDQSGESVTHQSMLGDSSQSRVQYKWRRGHMLGAGSYGTLAPLVSPTPACPRLVWYAGPYHKLAPCLQH